MTTVLKQKLVTLASEAGFNNDIGVPLTLLKLEATQQTAVLEVGTNHSSELAPLLDRVRPSYRVITNISREHLDFFGDLAGAASEEGWLAELLPANDKLFVNGDDEWLNRIGRRPRAGVAKVGFSDTNDWRVRGLHIDRQGAAFRLDGPRADFVGEHRINLIDRHQVANAIFAIAVGPELSLDRTQVEQGLAECRPAKMRLQLSELGSVRILDDAYNTNADSMLAALQTLQELPRKGRRVAIVLGMAELGADSHVAHEEVGRHAAGLGLGQLFAGGKMAGVMVQGARGAGLNRVFEFADLKTAAAALKGFVKDGDELLLNASCATPLERVVELLQTADGREGTECSIT